MSGIVTPSPAIKPASGERLTRTERVTDRKTNTMSNINSTSAKSSVLNLRLDDSTKAAIAGEAIRDGRSMSQIALRAIRLGLAQMIAPAPAPKVEAPKAPKAKGKSKGKGGDDGAAPAVAGKPRKK